MTVIECFTESHVDNIATCLRLHPDKVVMVGKTDKMRDSLKRYHQLLKDRGLSARISVCAVDRDDFREACMTLKQLVQEEDEYVIDLTGGDAFVVMAVGAVLVGLDENKRSHIRVEKYDHQQESAIDCIDNDRKLSQRTVNLTVEELVALHGGSLFPASDQPPVTCQRKDLADLWNMVTEDPKGWNRAIMTLNEFESRADSRTQVFLPLRFLRGSIANFDRKEALVRDTLAKFKAIGIIEDESTVHSLEYTYKSPLFRYCTLKAGSILEVKTLLEGRSVTENGEPFFHDCRMGVNIDWDGIVYEPEERIPETRNEIDVVLMHGTTPLFISCKNGNIGDDELYKLHTVATRFGGPYARKMLIATDLDRKSIASNRSFIQRAWDMDIILVTDAAELSPTEWQQLFLKAVQ